MRQNLPSNRPCRYHLLFLIILNKTPKFSYLHFVLFHLKESLETAQKEAQLCSGDGELPPERSADELTLQSPSQHTAQLVEEHSPAAYIDPTPQPDIGTDRTVPIPKVGNVPKCLNDSGTRLKELVISVYRAGVL
jgi:hypothetical protein